MDKTMIRYDQVNRAAAFKLQDKVLLLNNSVKMSLNPKLSEEWIGPFIVIGIENEQKYRIQGFTQSGKTIYHLKEKPSEQ